MDAATSTAAIQGVTDSAGYGPRIAPGSLASVFGTNFASGTDSAGGFPLPTSLDGASVTIGGVTAPLVYVSPTQINFQVPSSLKSGVQAVVVQGPGGASSSYNVTVTSAAPAIYQSGTNHAVVQNSDSSVNSDSAPAAAGSTVTVYLTGIGAVDNSVSDGSPTPTSPLSNATAASSATIGPMAATIKFLGLTPGFAGLAQANIQVPSLPAGDYPLVITVGGYVSASAAISVSGSGTYTSPLQLVSSVAFANSPVSSVALYSSVAYVCGASRIVMVNVSNASSPSIIGEFGDSVLNGRGVLCTINTAASPPYLVDVFQASNGSDSFAVYSLNNPQQPSLLTVAANTCTTSLDTCANFVSLSFSGNYGLVTTNYITFYTSNHAVAGQNGDLLAFDFTNPASPAFLGYMQPNGTSGSGDANLKPCGEVVALYYEFICSSTATGTSTAGTGFLDIVSIATPSAPVVANLVQISQAAILLRLDISGNVLLVAGNTAGQRNPGNPDFDFMGNLTLTTMDITNPVAPNVLATSVFSSQVNGTLSVEGFSNGVFAIVNGAPNTDDVGPTTLSIVDARNSGTILLEPFQTQFGFSGLLPTSTGVLLAPTSLGLNVYQLQLM